MTSILRKILLVSAVLLPFTVCGLGDNYVYEHKGSHITSKGIDEYSLETCEIQHIHKFFGRINYHLFMTSLWR